MATSKAPVRALEKVIKARCTLHGADPRRVVLLSLEDAWVGDTPEAWAKHHETVRAFTSTRFVND